MEKLAAGLTLWKFYTAFFTEILGNPAVDAARVWKCLFSTLKYFWIFQNDAIFASCFMPCLVILLCNENKKVAPFLCMSLFEFPVTEIRYHTLQQYEAKTKILFCKKSIMRESHFEVNPTVIQITIREMYKWKEARLKNIPTACPNQLYLGQNDKSKMFRNSSLHSDINY